MPPLDKCHDFESLREGQIARIRFSVSADDMVAFAAISGDHNPLHCDEKYAAARGFGGRVVYGAFLLAKVSQLIGMELPGRNSLWQSVEMSFRNPLLVGHSAVIEASICHISAVTRTIELSLKITSDEILIAQGKALVGVFNAK